MKITEKKIVVAFTDLLISVFGTVVYLDKKIKARRVRESLFNKMKKDKKRERLLKLKRARQCPTTLNF